MAARARRIVVGYSGSDASRRALDAAADLVGYGSTLAVVSVQAADAPDARQAVDQAREHLLRRQVTALYLERRGEPAEAIACAARTLDADVIVLGRAGALPDTALGSVSADVLRRAPCNVLVVR